MVICLEFGCAFSIITFDLLIRTNGYLIKARNGQTKP